mmetsp:Transcript_30404/g.93858  ORF Transcript_30404/g.93858 Transcript_30404/m.93858 type:complete len:233 (-) Transcript_30404:356-1054(-)
MLVMVLVLVLVLVWVWVWVGQRLRSRHQRAMKRRASEEVEWFTRRLSRQRVLMVMGLRRGLQRDLNGVVGCVRARGAGVCKHKNCRRVALGHWGNRCVPRRRLVQKDWVGALERRREAPRRHARCERGCGVGHSRYRFGDGWWSHKRIPVSRGGSMLRRRIHPQVALSADFHGFRGQLQAVDEAAFAAVDAHATLKPMNAMAQLVSRWVFARVAAVAAVRVDGIPLTLLGIC